MADFVSFTCTNGDDPVASVSRLLRGSLPTKERMAEAGKTQIARIQKRTAEGRDVNGATFAAYKPLYAKQRVKQGLRTSPPNLRVTGEMLDSLGVEVRSDTEFAITFGDEQAATIAEANSEGTSRIPARRFFDTSEQELDALLDQLVGGSDAR